MCLLRLLVILIAFIIFFDNADNVDAVPADVRVLGIEFRQLEGHLILDVCENVLNYGGTRFEYHFVENLTNLAAGFCGVHYFTLLINSELRELPEGIIIDKMSLH